jgi:hypothetical protein
MLAPGLEDGEWEQVLSGLMINGSTLPVLLPRLCALSSPSPQNPLYLAFSSQQLIVPVSFADLVF